MGQFLEEKANFLSIGYICGLLFDLGPYPVAVCADKHDQHIVGDIYALNECSNLLSILDDYEGVGELLETGVTFERKQIEVRLPDGSQLDAWVYLHTGYMDHLTPIATGDYLAYKRS